MPRSPTTTRWARTTATDLPAEVGALGVEVLAAVKAVLDPAGVLNPGTLVPVPPTLGAPRAPPPGAGRQPGGRGGRARRLLPAVEAGLRAAATTCSCGPPASLEHADELAAGVADDRAVVAMGGDGLVGRVAGTVADAGGLLGVLPGGRGNDFARAVGLAATPGARSRCWSTAGSGDVDLGEVSSAGGRRAFLGIASVGFDSEVQERALVSRLPLGQLVYLGAALATVSGWRPARFTAQVDGVPLGLTGWTFAVANSGTYGGGMRLAPAASLVDGLLDVVTVGAISRARFLRALPDVFRGTHVRRPGVAVRPGTRVELDADRPFRVFADGDPVGTLPCTVTVRARALRVLLPHPPSGSAA